MSKYPAIPDPEHLVLGDLIAKLEAAPANKRLPIGFANPHSYRGYYEDLAFEIAEDVTVGEMLSAARSALGATYQGWKGGDFKMDRYTRVWLVVQEGCSGESIGAVLVAVLLQAVEQ